MLLYKKTNWFVLRVGVHACSYKVPLCERRIITLVVVQYMNPCLFLFGALQRVGRLLATMRGAARLEALPLHRALARSHYSTIQWMRLWFLIDSEVKDGVFIGERESGVAIVGTFPSEQQKINDCQIGFLVTSGGVVQKANLEDLDCSAASSERHKFCREKNVLKRLFEVIELLFPFFFCSASLLSSLKYSCRRDEKGKLIHNVL